MKRVEYLKDKITIIWQLLFSHSYIVITEEDMMAHVCSDEDDSNFKNQVVLATHKLNRAAEARAAAE